ncbi:hypothetical protein TruAng_004465 [Truncatella angustata]|nr:hypothetical protein TruAng_004465 [Truncatella angustata]
MPPSRTIQAQDPGSTSTIPANPIHPDFLESLDQDFIDFYNATLGKAAPDKNASLEEVRKQRANYHSRGVRKLSQAVCVEDIKLQADDGYLFTVRLYKPDSRASPYGTGPYPVHINFHGGGFTFGDLNSDAKICMAIRNRLGILVADVDYRLRPEHALGKGHDDSWTAVQYIYSHGEEVNGRSDSISIGGISAGGQIAAVTQQRARDAGIPLKLAFLGVPVTASHAHYEKASDSEFPSFVENEFAPCLNWARIMFYRENSETGAIDEEAERAALPEFYSSPINGNLEGVCETFVGTASADPLRDEGELYGQKLVAAGVKTTVRRYQGVPHPFMHMPLKKAEMYMHDLVGALRTAHGVGIVKPIPTNLFTRRKVFQSAKQRRPFAAALPIRNGATRSWSWTPGRMGQAGKGHSINT